MILLAGGTGTLGTRLVPLLTSRGLEVRILTRNPERAAHLRGEQVEVAHGDVLDASDLQRATEGVQTVISAIHGFDGTGRYSPQTVDRRGNSNLIEAVRKSGADHFILMSMVGAAVDHPIEMFRMKYEAEQELRHSGLPWTIIRATAYMETWVRLLGAPLLTAGKTRIFGDGHNPVNFVSAQTVAQLVELAVVDPTVRGTVLEVGGPENLTFNQVVQIFETVTGKSGAKSYVPVPMMRAMSMVLRPFNPALARQIGAAVVMATRDMTFDAASTYRAHPSISPTNLSAVVRREYGGGVRELAGASSVA